MSFSPYSIPPLCASLIMAYIGFYVLLQDYRSDVFRAFFLFCFSGVGWLFGFSFLYSSQHPDAAIFWSRLSFLSVAFIPTTNLYFNLCLVDINRQKRFVSLSLFLISIVFAFLGLKTNLIYSSIRQYFWGFYPLAGSYYGLFMVFYIACWGAGLHLLYSKMLESKRANDFHSYYKIKYVFISWLGGSLGVVDFLPKYGITVYPFACIVGIYWVLALSIVVLPEKSRLNLSFMSRRVIIASVLFAAIGALFALIFFLLNKFEQALRPFHATILLVGLSIGFTLLLQPLYKGVRNLIDKMFFHEYYERRLKFAQLRQELLGADREEEFNRMILKAIDSSFKIVRVGLFIWNEKSRLFRLQAQSTWGNQQQAENDVPFPPDHPIPQILHNNEFYLHDRRNNTKFIDDKKSLLDESMRRLEANLLIPIKKDRLLGFLVLGEKESGLPYTAQDIDDLKNFARLTAVVTKTEQLLESRKELEQWNQELEKRVLERTSELETAQEELLKKSRLAIIGEVVSMVSHELKNPLGVINASSYFLENRLASAGDPLLLKHAQMVSAQADSMNRIITAILDYCRSRELMLQEGNINDLLRDVSASIQRPSDVLISMDLSPAVPASFFDKDELRQAMTNLMANGIEAIGKKGTLIVRTKPAGRDRITVEVVDSGCGIAENNLSRIFDPLFTTKSNGTGLGLAVVKKVVDRHEGNIKVESVIGQGTIFTLNLPVRMNGKKT